MSYSQMFCKTTFAHVYFFQNEDLKRFHEAKNEFTINQPLIKSVSEILVSSFKCSLGWINLQTFIGKLIETTNSSKLTDTFG